jgi:thioredoxin reductase (NADPH)
MHHVHEVAIIGAGPIGLELAVALKQNSIDYVHLEAKQIGHTISWFPPQTRFFSSNERIAIAGVPLQTDDQLKATREQYLAYLRSIVLQFQLSIRTFEPVQRVLRKTDHFELHTTRAGVAMTHRARRIALCTGGTDRPRRLGIPGEDLPHVSHYFHDPHLYFQQRLLIVGGKNSAVETALRCHHAGAHVSLSYRREKLPEQSIKYWLLPEINSYLKHGQIAGHFQTVPVEITRSHVTLARGEERFDVPADFVLLLVGYEQDNTLLKLCGVELLGVQQSPRFDPQTMETNVPGIYVAGTCVAGTQDKFKVFIENCHDHVDRIVGAITGGAIPDRPHAEFAQPES